MGPTLIALDHKKLATTLKTKNSTIEGFVKLTIKPKRSKTRDIKGHWLRYKKVLDQLRVYWYRGTKNYAYYFTKHHLPIHHRQMQPRYIHTSNLVRTIPHTIRLCECVFNRFLGT